MRLVRPGRRSLIAAGCVLAVVSASSRGKASGDLRADQSQTTAAPAAPAKPAAQAPASAVAVSSTDQALTKQYCQTCHNERLKTGGLSLENLSPADAAAHPEI